MSLDALFDTTSLDLDDNSIQSYRISQTLLAAGIDINMLNDMDKSRVVASLWADNTFQEEGGGMFDLIYEAGGLSDAIELTEDEINEGKSIYNNFKKSWQEITAEERKALRNKAKDKIQYIQQENASSGAVMPLSAVLAIVIGESRFAELTSTTGHAVSDNVPEYLKNELAGLGVALSGNIAAIDVAEITNGVGTSFSGKPAGHNSWAEMIKSPRAGNPLVVAEEKPVQKYNPENWQEFVIDKLAMEAKLAKEEHLN